MLVLIEFDCDPAMRRCVPTNNSLIRDYWLQESWWELQMLSMFIAAGMQVAYGLVALQVCEA